MQIFLTQMRRARFDNRVASVLFLMSCCFSAVLLSCTSCTSLETVPPESAGQSTVYVSAVSGQYPSSRTIISGDNLDKVLWSEKDRIGFYYRTAGSAPPAITMGIPTAIAILAAVSFACMPPETDTPPKADPGNGEERPTQGAGDTDTAAPSPAQDTIIPLLREQGPLHVDALGAALGRSPAELAPVLLGLEIMGRIRRLPGARYEAV